MRDGRGPDTFYFEAVDPDSTADPEDGDSRVSLSVYRAWLDGHEDAARYVPVTEGGVTFAPADFQGRYGTRTVYGQALDDGGAVSATIEHTWQVVAPPVDGILLVDDCRMGGFLETTSDRSYRNVLGANAAGRYVVLDIETVPRLSSTDLEATLSLFDRVVWYTDADRVSYGALQLARGGLEALLARNGRLFLRDACIEGGEGCAGARDCSGCHGGVHRGHRCGDGGRPLAERHRQRGVSPAHAAARCPGLPALPW